MRKNRIITFIAFSIFLIATVFVAVVMCASSPKAEILFKNVEFSGNLKLMYAVKSENLSDTDELRVVLCDENGAVVEKTVKGQAANINGVYCDVFTSERGVPAQNIDIVLYARAEIVRDGRVIYESELLPYSVLEYSWVRIDNTSLSDTERDMFRELISYAGIVDAFFNKTPDGKRIDDLVYVTVENGELDSKKSAGFYFPGDTLTVLPSGTADAIVVREYARDDTLVSSVTYGAEESCSVTVGENRMKISCIVPTALPHVDYSVSDGDDYNSELFYKNDFDIALGDPTVLPVTENGETWFYVSGTKSGKDFVFHKTRDFTEWIYVGVAYTPPENFFGVSSLWAPQLIYDEDADWSYYLGSDAGEGKGLYVLFFSAKTSDNKYKLAVAFSKNVEGPYENFVGTNLNGDYLDEGDTCFDIEKLNGLGLYENTAYGPLYKAGRGFIDACPYVDPISGDKYLYMVRNRSVDTSNDVWGVKMKDWVTPDYPTTVPLSANRYTTVEKDEQYGFISNDNIDEGPFVYYKDMTDDGIDNGKYYLTLSIGATNDKYYPVCQAISDSPLGPFVKIQPEDHGLISIPGELWDIHGTGHHCFFEIGGELFLGNHTYALTSGATIGTRYFAFSKVEWIQTDDGLALMRANGPHKTIQPLPEASSKYENLAEDASFTVKGDVYRPEALNDGLIALSEDDFAKECYVRGDGVITVDFGGAVILRSIMIYNSYDYGKIFREIEKVELSYCTVVDGKLYRGIAVIDDLGFNIMTHLVPDDYLSAVGAIGPVVRPMGAAIAEFAEIAVESMSVYVTSNSSDSEIAISEIVALGRPWDINPDSYPYGGLISKQFDEYLDFVPSPSKKVVIDEYITLDGVLDEAIWQDPDAEYYIAGTTKDASDGNAPIDIEIWGERSATVYTHISDTTVYFAFDVKDPNLFYNQSQPQGRSTCVELYLTTRDKTTLTEGCYSIRVNPTGAMNGRGYRLGTYVPNDTSNEWATKDLGGAVAVAVTVNGTVVNTSSGTKDPDNVGYTVEIAISRRLLDVDVAALRFTAAFVQDKGFNLNRLGNSFISGTSYIRPSGWKIVDVSSEENDS